MNSHTTSSPATNQPAKTLMAQMAELFGVGGLVALGAAGLFAILMSAPAAPQTINVTVGGILVTVYVGGGLIIASSLLLILDRILPRR